MLVSACVLPHPPVLVPQVAVQSPDWLVDLRQACLAAVARVAAADPEIIAVVGPAKVPGKWDSTAGATLAAFGVDVSFGGPVRELPLALAIGAYLLDQVDWTGERASVAVDGSDSAEAYARLGRTLVAGQRTGLLVMGDGSAKRSTLAPGYFDDRARSFDAQVVKAITDLDAPALTHLDPSLADDLWVAGLPAWQVLAGIADDADVPVVRYDDAPTGVGYFVIDIPGR